MYFVLGNALYSAAVRYTIEAIESAEGTISCISNCELLIAKNSNTCVAFAFNVKSTLCGFTIFESNVIVYGLAQLITLRIYVCHSFIVDGCNTIKSDEGAICERSTKGTLFQEKEVNSKSE